MPAQSLIAEFLRIGQIKGGDEVITGYKLEKFEVNVLDIKRTVAEKIIGLVRASRNNDPERGLANKISHIYDLYLIKRNAQYSNFFLLIIFYNSLILSFRPTKNSSVMQETGWTNLYMNAFSSASLVKHGKTSGIFFMVHFPN